MGTVDADDVASGGGGVTAGVLGGVLGAASVTGGEAVTTVCGDGPQGLWTA
jgi:hypothetical protein